MIEVFKIINGLSPPIMDKIFIFRENTHNIRNFQIISKENTKTVRYGQETIKFRTPVQFRTPILSRDWMNKFSTCEFKW